ncbi:hypothetical protein RIF29_06835 [Crotalaria pallida]|uniref:Uncharacterized protein n=1 Tax=Crotalaria pallida TaxID=3830 RepID=A0AAN9PB51_CROPI
MACLTPPLHLLHIYHFTLFAPLSLFYYHATITTTILHHQAPPPTPLFPSWDFSTTLFLRYPIPRVFLCQFPSFCLFLCAQVGVSLFSGF